jgi:hypothetical protein
MPLRNSCVCLKLVWGTLFYKNLSLFFKGQKNVHFLFFSICYWTHVMIWMVSCLSFVFHSMNVDSLSWFVNVVIGEHKRMVSLFQSWWWCHISSALCGWRYRHTSWYATALGGGSGTRLPSFHIPSLRYGTALGIWLYLGLLMNNIAVFHHALDEYLHVRSQVLKFSQLWQWRMPFSLTWHHVALARTDVSEELVTSIMVKIISGLWTLAVTSN